VDQHEALHEAFPWLRAIAGHYPGLALLERGIVAGDKIGVVVVKSLHAPTTRHDSLATGKASVFGVKEIYTRTDTQSTHYLLNLGSQIAGRNPGPVVHSAKAEPEQSLAQLAPQMGLGLENGIGDGMPSPIPRVTSGLENALFSFL
jgi:hypothetical protein